MIGDLRDEGVTVLMSTHYIEEAERLSDTVIVMAKGQVVARGRPADLVLEHAGRQVLEVYGPPSHLHEVQEWAASAGRVTRRTGPGSRSCAPKKGTAHSPKGSDAPQPRGHVRPPHRRARDVNRHDDTVCGQRAIESCVGRAS